MNAVRVETTIKDDGELHLTELPCRRGDKVEAIVLILAPSVQPNNVLTSAELRRMPREQRQAILATAAALAEQDYREDKELTGFDAFSEEELNDE